MAIAATLKSTVLFRAFIARRKHQLFSALQIHGTGLYLMSKIVISAVCKRLFRGGVHKRCTGKCDVYVVRCSYFILCLAIFLPPESLRFRRITLCTDG